MAKILIADDSRFQVALLSKALEESGFEVLCALDALQAWMIALRSAPDAIVLDINMPGGSGIEVLRKLRISTKRCMSRWWSSVAAQRTQSRNWRSAWVRLNSSPSPLTRTGCATRCFICCHQLDDFGSGTIRECFHRPLWSGSDDWVEILLIHTIHASRSSH